MRLRIAHRLYRRPFRTPLRTGQGPWPVREGLVLRVEDESGKVGFGEAAPIPWFRGMALKEVSDRLLSLGDYTEEERLVELFSSGVGAHAVSAALSDRLGFGARPDVKALAVAALLPAGKEARTVLRARAEEGFRTFKWKVGVAPARDEWGLLDDLLSDLPDGARLRLDANGAWDRRTAEGWLDRAADRPIEFIEQPIAADAKSALDLLQGLAEDYPTPLALDESIGGDEEIREWLRVDWRGVWVIKLSLLGDVAGTLAALTRQGARLVFSSALEGPLGRAANLRTVFSLPGPHLALGYGLGELFEDSSWNGGPLFPFLRDYDLTTPQKEALWNELA